MSSMFVKSLQTAFPQKVSFNHAGYSPRSASTGLFEAAKLDVVKFSASRSSGVKLAERFDKAMQSATVTMEQAFQGIFKLSGFPEPHTRETKRQIALFQNVVDRVNIQVAQLQARFLKTLAGLSVTEQLRAFAHFAKKKGGAFPFEQNYAGENPGFFSPYFAISTRQMVHDGLKPLEAEVKKTELTEQEAWGLLTVATTVAERYGNLSNSLWGGETYKHLRDKSGKLAIQDCRFKPLTPQQEFSKLVEKISPLIRTLENTYAKVYHQQDYWKTLTGAQQALAYQTVHKQLLQVFENASLWFLQLQYSDQPKQSLDIALLASEAFRSREAPKNPMASSNKDVRRATAQFIWGLLKNDAVEALLFTPQVDAETRDKVIRFGYDLIGLFSSSGPGHACATAEEDWFWSNMRPRLEAANAEIKSTPSDPKP